jgi:hypothetical protein
LKVARALGLHCHIFVHVYDVEECAISRSSATAVPLESLLYCSIRAMGSVPTFMHGLCANNVLEQAQNALSLLRNSNSPQWGRNAYTQAMLGHLSVKITSLLLELVAF